MPIAVHLRDWAPREYNCAAVSFVRMAFAKKMRDGVKTEYSVSPIRIQLLLLLTMRGPSGIAPRTVYGQLVGPIDPASTVLSPY